MKRMTYLLASAALATFSATASSADNYTAASTWNDAHAITANQFTNFAAHLAEATSGEINFEVFHSASLLPPKSTLGGLGDGLGAYVHITGAYLPADLPLDNVLNDLSIVASDPIAAGIAITEVKMLHPKMQAEYAKHGVVMGSGYSTSEYIFICKDPVHSLAELQGKKIRTGGTVQVRLVEKLGAVPVSVPATEMYTGLQRGSVDCALGDPSFLTTSFKLQEVAGGALNLRIGTHTSGGNYFNAKFWKGLTPEQRRTVLNELGRSVAELEVDWKARGAAALEEASGNGVEIITPNEEMTAFVSAFRADVIDTLSKSAMEARGVDDPSDLIASYLEAEAKWVTLLAGIDATDPAAVTKLVQDELYSKIDENAYGLN